MAAERGSQLVEAALLLPVLLTLLLGILYIGRAFNVYQTITRAAREGARFAAAPTCSTCVSGNTSPSDGEVTAVINGFLSASALDPTKVSPAISILRNQVLNPSDPAANQVKGVVVTFGFPFTLAIPFTSLSGTTITISTKVQIRQEF
ncbi:MAG: pilus assembly protein [Acidobacteria bacterium]|nr:pilus assembly protein [Acidobacteriota bacterium]